MAQSDLIASVTTVTRVQSGANAAVQGTVAARASHRHMVSGYTVSFNQTPGADVTVLIQSGSTTLDEFEVASGNNITVYTFDYVRPLRGGENEAITIDVDAAGAAVVSTAVLRTYAAYS